MRFRQFRLRYMLPDLFICLCLLARQMVNLQYVDEVWEATFYILSPANAFRHSI